MKHKYTTLINLKIIVLFYLVLTLPLAAQIIDDELEQSIQTPAPQAVDFSKMFEEEEETRDDYADMKRQKEALLREQMNQPDALEAAVDPEQYIVGPGDIFSFNIWGPLESQIPAAISPEGKLAIPSVGEIVADGLTLSQLQDSVYEKAKPFYEGSDISLTLESLRYCRVHVTGEVKFPGTYVAQATNRMSTLITDAGGVTENANKGAIILKRLNGDKFLFDLSYFEQFGDLDGNICVTGGDVIFVPAVDLSKPFVHVEGDFNASGLYQINEDEELFNFLQRIRAVKRNTDITKVVVIRGTKILKPFAEDNSSSFKLIKNDLITIPAAFVYVKGAVQKPGAYPYIQNFTAKDYAGMAGGDYQSAGIRSVKIFSTATGKTRKGPDIVVQPGDVVDLPQGWGSHARNWGTFISALASSVLAARAAGLIGN